MDTRQQAKIRTFHPRRGRLGDRRGDIFERLWPVYGLEIPRHPDQLLDVAALFGRSAPLVLEIGSGMGEATWAMAAADPDRDYLAVEVHTPGIASLLGEVEERGLTNVRVGLGDAVELVEHMLVEESLSGVHVFFPDPWPKARHHKRRLIQPAHVALLRSRLVPGGRLHCATDWAEYAEQMLSTVEADPGLVNEYDGFAPRPDWRPMTKFERRGRDAGRDIFDLICRRR
ncbi:tRNA (guanine-N7-)-methyltransferase [Allocatelliglobosispora scoriae]|uniref:tRNA (guanine-N(7)-)-methyltransferase n=1 Tax=Allocatelliglobosispora scoriae TaxID=643052 RepID=A0A841BUR5_9ACTN|nr:tRNA (guanosine(46)-N7)-methyltransferase TrmB [Allocatelliglobosispora scoriae]MBB5872857.1 tRNA (guanine-N7-)-methyltransferase [Allocatelliglobosispora scoriae]